MSRNTVLIGRTDCGRFDIYGLFMGGRKVKEFRKRVFN